MAIISSTKKNLYKDFDLRMKVNPMTNDITSLVDYDTVKAAIKNIVFTNLNEKPFNQSFGGNIRNFLFEELDIFSQEVIALHIKDLIAKYEPRAINVGVSVSFANENDLMLDLSFTLVKKETEAEKFQMIIRRLR